VAVHVQRYPTLDLPRPFRSAAPLLGLAAGALLFEVDPALPWLVGIAAAAFFAAAAGIRWTRERLALQAVRRTADRLIVAEPSSRDASELVRWRKEELTSRDARDALCREIDRLLADLDPRLLPAASPLRRPAARANEELIVRIRGRIGGGRPLCARGVLLTQWLLRDASSPLYDDEAERTLPRALVRILGALEP
jgi:hypothetical protein